MLEREEESTLSLLITIPIIFLSSILMLVTRAISDLFKPSKKELDELDYESDRDTCEELNQVFELSKKKTNFDPMKILKLSYDEVYSDLQEGKKSEKVHALMELRSHAFCYNFTFIGVVESTKFSKLNMEDYDRTGKLPTSFLVQKVDFGYNINNALSKLFGLKLKEHRGMCKNYLVLEDGIVYDIEEKLSKLLMNDVKIKFIDKESLTNLEK